ncbi:hypothetical protein L1049_002351 [Liquidambar formosana]|uniref:Cytochrome P450 n=1 Tax=Liquidambar formosana TaxID=63359 RepID=A0AAP0NER6_LIQFO
MSIYSWPNREEPHFSHYNHDFDIGLYTASEKRISTTLMEINVGYAATLLLAIFFFLCFHHWSSSKKKSSPITNWPLLGMLPGLLHNSSHIHKYLTQVLKQSGGTLEFKGPRFANLDILLTSDPSNVHHILIKNFKNFEKGP